MELSLKLIPFVLATFAVLVTPGITISALTGNTLSHGVRAGLLMEVGALIARFSMIAVLALGLDVISNFMLVAFDWVKLFGAAYLIWMGIKTIRHPPQFSNIVADKPSAGRQMVSGFVTLWSNPKALIFFGAFLPQFVDVSLPVAPQILVMGAIWVGLSVITDGCYISLAGGARHLLRGRVAKRLGLVSGSMLIGAGVWLATTQKS